MNGKHPQTGDEFDRGRGHNSSPTKPISPKTRGTPKSIAEQGKSSKPKDGSAPDSYERLCLEQGEEIITRQVLTQ